jgi:chromosome segregation ATPase
MKTPAQTNQDGTTSFLIDFTQQIESMGSHSRATPARASNPGLLQYLSDQRSPAKSARPSFATPAKSNSILNLLDFELPPAPTPRSIPTITVRELESLKSSYLSQISGLKATLSGREAEVESLKRAIGDAERRAGEAQEHLREEKCRREQAEEEKAGWERRGEELANVLKNVREEVLKSEADKEDFIRKFEESEQRVDDAESRASAAEERLASAEERLASALAERATTAPSSAAAENDTDRVQALVAAQIDAKIESVSRELHTIYKEKHERKVATLKKSYEARSEKKLSELHTRVADLEKQNDDLLAAKDATFSGALGNVDMSIMESANAATSEAQALKVLVEELKAGTARLETMLETAQKEQSSLREELKQERIEKGELVAAVDEMLALQAAATAPLLSSSSSAAKDTISATPVPQQQRALSSAVEDLRRSIARPTGLRAPSSSSTSSVNGSTGESRIGIPTPAAASRSLSAATAGMGSSSALGKSRMLANIERMGRTNGAGGGAGGQE